MKVFATSALIFVAISIVAVAGVADEIEHENYDYEEIQDPCEYGNCTTRPVFHNDGTTISTNPFMRDVDECAKGIGDMCSSDSECCAGTCVGKCCISTGQECGGPKECCSSTEKCLRKSGTTDSHKCMVCKDVGAACTAGDVCCRGNCNGGKCCTASNAVCKYKGDCCSDGDYCARPAGSDASVPYKCVKKPIQCAEMHASCSVANGVKCCRGSCVDGTCCVTSTSECELKDDCCKSTDKCYKMTGSSDSEPLQCNAPNIQTCITIKNACNASSGPKCCRGSCVNGVCCIKSKAICKHKGDCCVGSEVCFKSVKSEPFRCG